MFIQTKEIFKVPADTTVHYFSFSHPSHSLRHSLFCGTVGYDLTHSDIPRDVTCQRCLDKLRSCSDRRFAKDPNVTMSGVLA
jgi:hypothetical protein